MELWSLMHFLMPGLFASHAQFRDWFCNPLTGMVECSEAYNKQLVERLHGVLRPFLLRRLKSEVERQMPAKHEHVVHCRLSKWQRQLYEEYMASSETKKRRETGGFLGMLNCLMSLRKATRYPPRVQVCNHPGLFEGRPIVSSNDLVPGLSIQVPSCILNPCYVAPPSLRPPPRRDAAAAAGGSAGAAAAAAGPAPAVSPDFAGPLEHLHPAFRPAGHYGACGSAGVAGRIYDLLSGSGLLLTAWEGLATWEAEDAMRLLVPYELMARECGVPEWPAASDDASLLMRSAATARSAAAGGGGAASGSGRRGAGGAASTPGGALVPLGQHALASLHGSYSHRRPGAPVGPGPPRAPPGRGRGGHSVVV